MLYNLAMSAAQSAHPSAVCYAVLYTVFFNLVANMLLTVPAGHGNSSLGIRMLTALPLLA